MNKRGQFFLVAALIIIGIVIGLASAVNTINVSREDKRIISLKDELNIEPKYVLDYGTYNSQDTQSLAIDFLDKYVNELSQEEVLFVYGDRTGIIGLVYREDSQGNVGIRTGAIPGVIEIQYTTGEQANVTREGNKVFVEVNGIIYKFDLREGRNFFFVIGKEENGEKHVVTG